MKLTLLLITSLIGTALVLRSSYRYYLEVKQRPREQRSTMDSFLNHPLQILWNLYLLAFFIGLTANNL